jgi:hypothetical protein
MSDINATALSFSTKDGANKYTATFGELPASTQAIIVNKGWSRLFTNDVSSAISFEKKKYAKANEGAEMPEAEVAALTIRLMDETLAEALAGTLGVRAARNSDPVEDQIEEIALKNAKNECAKGGVEWPKSVKDQRALANLWLNSAKHPGRAEKVRALAEQYVASMTAFD